MKIFPRSLGERVFVRTVGEFLRGADAEPNFWRRIIEIGAAARYIDAPVNSNQSRAFLDFMQISRQTMAEKEYSSEIRVCKWACEFWQCFHYLARLPFNWTPLFISRFAFCVFVYYTINCAPSLKQRQRAESCNNSGSGVLRVRARGVVAKKQVAAPLATLSCSWPFALASRARWMSSIAAIKQRLIRTNGPRLSSQKFNLCECVGFYYHFCALFRAAAR